MSSNGEAMSALDFVSKHIDRVESVEFRDDGTVSYVVFKTPASGNQFPPLQLTPWQQSEFTPCDETQKYTVSCVNLSADDALTIRGSGSTAAIRDLQDQSAYT